MQEKPSPAASQPEKVTIRGRVVGPKGEPVADARILFGELDGRDSLVNQVKAPTDNQGRYECPVKSGRYLIAIAELPNAYTPSHERHERREVRTDTDWPDFAVRAARGVDLVVVDEAGKPVRGAGVRVATVAPQFFDSKTEISTDFRTDDQGRVTIQRLDDEDRYAIYALAGERVSDGPAMVTISEVSGPVRIPISSAAATRVAGRVVDPAGEGIVDADVTIQWSILDSSRVTSNYGFSVPIVRTKTNEKGEYLSPGLWSGDRFRVSATKQGYSSNDAAEQPGARGEKVEFPPIVLQKLGGALAGRVVDAEGKPVAGAKAFFTYSSRRAVTEESGRFEIAEARAPSAIVLVEKEGYRLAAFAVGPDRTADLIIRRTEDGPPPRSPALPEAERIAIGRELLTALWNRSWSPRARPDKDLIRAMAKLDTGLAAEWSAQCGGAHDATVRHQRADNLLASGDIQSAVSVLAAQEPTRAMMSLSAAIDRQTPTAPEQAVKIAEEALAVIRRMDPLDTAAQLAQLGRQLILLKKPEAGRKLIEEAAAALPQVGAAPMSGFYQREIAGGLAAIDVERAYSIAASIADQNERRFATSYVIQIAARFDPRRAAALLDRIEDRMQRDQVCARVAVQLGQADWDAGVQLVEKIEQVASRSQALGWLAVQRANTDRAGAHALLRRALDDLIKNRDELFGYITMGGPGVFGAHLAVLAAKIDHPDVDIFVAAAMGLQLAPNMAGRAEDAVSANVKSFGLLGLADPALARQALDTQAAAQQHVPARGLGRVEWIAAWAVADPPRVPDLVMQAVANLPDGDSPLWISGVTPALMVLSTSPAERSGRMFVLYTNSPIWFPYEDY